MNYKKEYNEPMSITGFTYKEDDGKGEEVLLVGIKGEHLEQIKELQKRVDVKELQDVVKLAIILLDRMSQNKKDELNGKKS